MRIGGYDLQLSAPARVETRSVGTLTSDLKDPTEWFIRAVSGMAQSATGISVTPLKALGVACVFSCVRVLADTIATLPLEIHQRQGRRRKLAVDHPLFTALSLRPNDEMSSTDWRRALMTNLALNGAAYSEVLRNSDDDVIGVYPIESSRVDFYRDTKTKQLKYRVMDGDRGGQSFTSDEMLHFKGNTVNGLSTLNTTITARECIALALAMQDNAAKFFGNGSRPNGVLKHPLQLSKEAQNRLRDEFEENAAGKNLYRLMVLEEGLEYVATRSENKDSQFQESRDAQNLEICRIFGVPPHKAGIVGSQPKANVEESNIEFVMDRVRPICFGLEQEFDLKVLTEFERDQGYCCRFNIDAIMRGNRKARFDCYAIGRQWGILTTNDCRAEEGLDDVENGDVLLQPINMADVKEVSKIQMKSTTTQKEGGAGGKPNATT